MNRQSSLARYQSIPIPPPIITHPGSGGKAKGADTDDLMHQHAVFIPVQTTGDAV